MLQCRAATAAAWATCTKISCQLSVVSCQLNQKPRSKFQRAGLFLFWAECSTWNTMQFILYVWLCMLSTTSETEETS